MKICSKCKKEKSLDQFSRNINSKDGFCWACKTCSAKDSRAWRKANPEQHKAGTLAWRLANRVRVKNGQRDWREKNREWVKERDLKWRKSNPEILAASGHRRALKRYNISEEDFILLKKKQQNKCAICQEGFKKTPRIDHDHVTGKVRGLLCNTCNISLGGFKDSPRLLQAASNYLLTAPRSCGILT